MPEISEQLKNELLRFKTSQAATLGGNELRDLKNYVQQTYRMSLDAGCGKCVSKWMNRIIKDNNI